jgi:hypothetical protein
MNMKRCILVILLGAIAWAVTAEAPVPLRRFALVAGSNDGGTGRVRLKYAETDARSIASVLQELGGVRAEDMVLLASPDLGRFQDALGRIAQMVKAPREMDERRELVFYYSGHSDDDGLILGKDRFSWEDLRGQINGISADVKVAILDSCSSGSLTRAKGGVARPAFLFDASADMKGYAFLTSASAEEAAQESDRIGASFFTHYLITGLRGAADTMGNGVVTLNEAYAFAFKETLASTENTQYGPQHPAYDISLTGSGDLVLTDLRSASAGLTVAEEVKGRLYIRDAQGALVIELNKMEGQKVDLALEPGTYSVLLDSQGRRLAGTVRVSGKQRGMVVLASLHPAPVERATARGDFPAGDTQNGPQAAVAPVDPATAIGAAVGAAVGSAIGKAVGSAVNAAITAAATAARATPPGPPADAPSDSAGTAPAQDSSNVPGTPRPEALSFSLLPDLPGGLFSSSVDRVVSFNLLVGASSSSLAFELGGLANFEARDVRGFQSAGLLNAALGELSGFQSAGLVNYVKGPARFMQAAGLVNASGSLAGAQAAGLVNVSSSLAGAQLAGLGNVSGGESRGVQAAGLFNWSSGDMRGAQLAGMFNWASAGMTGAQIAGFANWGTAVRGPQISVLNIADTVSGAQIGVVNIARHVSGTQVGVFNFSQEIDGVPIGLLSIEGRGRHDLEVWVDMGGESTAALSFGTKHVYTIFSAGWVPGSTPSLWTLGLGLGGRSDIGPLFLDYELSWVAQSLDLSLATSGGIGSMYPRLRATIGLPLSDWFAIEAGVTLRMLIPYVSDSLFGSAGNSQVLFQPGFIVGVQI